MLKICRYSIKKKKIIQPAPSNLNNYNISNNKKKQKTVIIITIKFVLINGYYQNVRCLLRTKLHVQDVIFRCRLFCIN